jgi:integrase
LRNPNGFGSIYKLSGKRRKPFIVRKTIGWDDDGKQLYQTIGYYATRAEAMTALAQFNANPYDIDAAKVTFTEVFAKWSDKKFSKISQSNINGYKAAYKTAEQLHEMKFVDVKTEHLQGVIDDCGKGYDSLRKIRVLFNQLFKYAIEKDVISKDYSAFIELPDDESESTRMPFNANEINALWNNVHRMEFIDTILIMIYTGLRPGELLLMKTADIDIEERTMRGGIKTKAGKNRVIPINKKILPLIQERLKLGYEFLVVNYEGNQMRYWNFYEEKWKKIMEQLEMEHKPHDCRHTFATLMDNAEANKVAIKRIMGHASQDITDKVYTHKDIEQLITAVDLI